jgi:hypothetical protein
MVNEQKSTPSGRQVNCFEAVDYEQLNISRSHFDKTNMHDADLIAKTRENEQVGSTYQ